ncbi:helix-turn-helix domain-containing protein [Micromonospora sp. NPDC050397]|uniref:helix-turn-helix domain-containing protein n=1 Tax=Micromonospora sp. NPDC050397 TaxID=3364279 RepID=UPI00384E2AB4
MITAEQVAQAHKDLGRLLVTWRKASGKTQEKLGRSLGYSRSTIANLETGRSRSSRKFWEAADVDLHAGGELMKAFDHVDDLKRDQAREVVRRAVSDAAAMRARSAATAAGSAELLRGGARRPVDNPVQGGDTNEMLRRTVLIALAGTVGSVATGFGPVSEDVGRGLAGVDRWQEAAWEYGYAYVTTPRRYLVADLAADLAAVQEELHRQTSPGTAKPLAAVAAQLAGLTAMACTDLGFAREARHLWRLARYRAEESTDAAVQQWVAGHEITLGSYQQRPLPVLLDLANRALALADETAPSAGKAELLGGQAQALALLGRTRDAQKTLDSLRLTFEHLPSSVSGEQDSIYGWPEQRLRHAESFVYSMAGKTDAAYRAQELALRLYPQARRIGRCQIELHRARCLIRDGSLSDGLRHASATLDYLGVDQRQQFVLAVARQVLHAVPQSQRQRGEAIELRERVQAAQTSTLLIGSTRGTVRA